jgi:antitoxin VapB
MAFHVRDPATDEAVRRLTKLRAKSFSATIREAVENEYKRECEQQELSLWERLQPLHSRLDALSKPGGKPADKAFFDELSGEF